MADVAVSDAFGAVHRAHASTAGVAAYLPAVSGFLIQKELGSWAAPWLTPSAPLVAILGGSKVSSKIGVINHLLDIADTIIIGGGMCYTFAKAQGIGVGNSAEADWLDYCREMMRRPRTRASSCSCPWTAWPPRSFHRCQAGGRGRRGVSRRHDGYGHRAQDHRPVCRGREKRPAPLSGTAPWACLSSRLAEGTRAVAQAWPRPTPSPLWAAVDSRPPWPSWLRRQNDHLHRRRRAPRVPGGQGAARRGVPAG